MVSKITWETFRQSSGTSRGWPKSSKYQQILAYITGQAGPLAQKIPLYDNQIRACSHGMERVLDHGAIGPRKKI